MSYDKILEQKKAYYGNTEAAHEFAAEQYATICIIQELEAQKVAIEEKINTLKKRIKGAK